VLILPVLTRLVLILPVLTVNAGTTIRTGNSKMTRQVHTARRTSHATFSLKHGLATLSLKHGLATQLFTLYPSSHPFTRALLEQVVATKLAKRQSHALKPAYCKLQKASFYMCNNNDTDLGNR
jgi:hypothetical protein